MNDLLERDEWDKLGDRIAQGARAIYDETCITCPDKTDCVLTPRCSLLIECERQTDILDEVEWVIHISLMQREEEPDEFNTS